VRMEVATALVSASIKLSESAGKDSTSDRSRVSSISEGGVSWLSVFSHSKEGSRQGMERDVRRYSREAEEAMAGGLGKADMYLPPI